MPNCRFCGTYYSPSDSSHKCCTTNDIEKEKESLRAELAGWKSLAEENGKQLAALRKCSENWGTWMHELMNRRDELKTECLRIWDRAAEIAASPEFRYLYESGPHNRTIEHAILSAKEQWEKGEKG